MYIAMHKAFDEEPEHVRLNILDTEPAQAILYSLGQSFRYIGRARVLLDPPAHVWIPLHCFLTAPGMP
jgi:hypothetical protein